MRITFLPGRFGISLPNPSNLVAVDETVLRHKIGVLSDALGLQNYPPL